MAPGPKDGGGNDQMSAIKALRAQLSDMEDQLDEETEAKDAAVAARSALEEELESLRKECESLRDSSKASDANGADTAAEAAAAAAAAAAAVDLAEVRQEAEALKARLEEAAALKAQLEEAQTANASLETSLREARVHGEDLEAAKAALEGLLADAEKKSQGAPLEAEKLQVEFAELRAAKESLEASLREAQTDRERIQAEKVALDGRLAETEKARSDAQEAGAKSAGKGQNKNKNKKLEAELADVKASRDGFEKQVAQLKEQLSKASQDAEAAKNTMEADAASNAEAATARCAALEAEVIELSTARKHLEASLAESSKEDEQASACKTRLQKELADAVEAKGELAIDVAAAEARAEAAEVRATQAEDRLKAEESSQQGCEAELAKLRGRLEQARAECTELISDRDCALERVGAAEQTREADAEQVASLSQLLESEVHKRLECLESQSELQHAHDENLKGFKTMRQRVDVLEDQLEQEREGRVIDADGAGKALAEAAAKAERELGVMRTRQADLEQDCTAERRRADDLTVSVEAERRARAATAEELETERRLRAASDAERAAERSELHAEISRATEAGGDHQQRASELQIMVDALQPAHEEVFSKFSKAVEHIDSLKEELKKVCIDRDRLNLTLEEEREIMERTRREFEEAEPQGPTQLKVSDVLISVVFDGIAAPLELQPWDTNHDAVVTAWLSAGKRNMMMRPSVVRYLKHLEDTTQVFPVRVEAKLHEVHEEFAM